METEKFSLIKIVFILFLSVYGIWGIINIQNFWLLESVNLPFHELGHFLFILVGGMPQFFAGTIAQLAIPAGIEIYFILKQKYYSAAVVLFWLGENFLGISNYIKDARSQDLPLLFEGSLHDWHYILDHYDLLIYDQIIGNIVFGMGIFLLLLSVVLGLLTAKR